MIPLLVNNAFLSLHGAFYREEKEKDMDSNSFRESLWRFWNGGSNNYTIFMHIF